MTATRAALLRFPDAKASAQELHALIIAMDSRKATTPDAATNLVAQAVNETTAH
jgi:hypothetical protein